MESAGLLSGMRWPIGRRDEEGTLSFSWREEGGGYASAVVARDGFEIVALAERRDPGREARAVASLSWSVEGDRFLSAWDAGGRCAGELAFELLKAFVASCPEEPVFRPSAMARLGMACSP